MEVVRSTTTPRHIWFEFRSTKSIEAETKKLCDQLHVEQGEKAIVYMDSIGNGTMLHKEAGWPFYHAQDRNYRDRQEMLAKWSKKGGVMVATSALGLGMDYKKVVLVVVWTSRQLMDVVQMFGRGGRDGSPATGAMLCSKPVHDDADLVAYAGPRCRKETSSRFLDDESGVCGLDDNRCGNCTPNRVVAACFPLLSRKGHNTS